MLIAMELDRNVAWPATALATGDNVIYDSSTDDSVNATRLIKAWVRGNQAGTLLVQVWNGAAWITINGSGSGVAVAINTWFEISIARPGGRHRLVLNYAVVPTVYEHPSHFRMCIRP